MDKRQETENQQAEKKSKKEQKRPVASQSVVSEGMEPKASIKVTFEGEAAQKILKCESDLKDRLSKPDMGKILGAEILTWTDRRWSEIVEENTDIEYFFAQIRKCSDKSKSIKLLKALSEKLKSESSDGSAFPEAPSSLPVAQFEESATDAG